MNFQHTVLESSFLVGFGFILSSGQWVSSSWAEDAMEYRFERLWPYTEQSWYFDYPNGLAVGTSESVFVADTANHRIQVLDSDGTLVSTWGEWGTESGKLSYPLGVAVDGTGRVYVTDDLHRIQVFDTDGLFLAGWGSPGRDEGQFDQPMGIAVDGAGHIYVADRNNHRVQVFDWNGSFVRTWGDRGNGEEQLHDPSGIAIDAAGRVYVADTGNARVEVFDKNGSFVQSWGSEGTGQCH